MNPYSNNNLLLRASCCVLALVGLSLLSGCGNNAGKGMPRLSKTVSLGKKGSIKFPKTPEKMDFDQKIPLPDNKYVHIYGKGGTLSHEFFHYEAGCAWTESNLDKETFQKAFDHINQNTRTRTIGFSQYKMEHEKLSNGTDVYIVIGTDAQNQPKSARYVETPDRRNYSSELTYKSSEIPTSEQIKHEKAFHNSLRVGWSTVKDSLGAKVDDLFAERAEMMRKYEEGRAAREEAERRRAAQLEIERKRLEEQAENVRNRFSDLRSVARGQTATDNADEQAPDATAQSSQRFSGPPMPFRPGPIGRPGFNPFPGAVSLSDESDSQQQNSVNQNNVNQDSVNQEQNASATGSPPANAQRPPVPSNPAQSRPAMPNFNNSVGMSRAGKGFSETTPNDYVLVGFAVTLKKWGNNSNDSIESVQPLYRVLNGTATKRGAVCGNATGASKTVYAPAGYAVGAINGRAVAIVDGLELICMKIKPDGTLDPNDTKALPWVGNTEAGSPKLVDGKGQPVLEVKGYADEFLSSLEFVF